MAQFVKYLVYLWWTNKVLASFWKNHCISVDIFELTLWTCWQAHLLSVRHISSLARTLLWTWGLILLIFNSWSRQSGTRGQTNEIHMGSLNCMKSTNCEYCEHVLWVVDKSLRCCSDQSDCVSEELSRVWSFVYSAAAKLLETLI